MSTKKVPVKTSKNFVKYPKGPGQKTSKKVPVPYVKKSVNSDDHAIDEKKYVHYDKKKSTPKYNGKGAISKANKNLNVKKIKKEKDDDEESIESMDSTEHEIDPELENPEKQIKKRKIATPKEESEKGETTDDEFEEDEAELDNKFESRQFFDNFGETVADLIEQIKEEEIEDFGKYFGVIKKSYNINVFRMKRDKDNIKKKIEELRKQKKEIVDMKKKFKALRGEFIFFNQDKINSDKWNETPYATMKKSMLINTPFEELNYFYRQKFDTDEDFEMSYANKISMIKKISKVTCKKCYLISHSTKECSTNVI